MLRSWKSFIVTISLSVCGSYSFCQNQQIADSLVRIYLKGGLSDSTKSQFLHDIAFYQTQPDSILRYANLLIEFASQNSDNSWLYKGYFQRGNAHRLKGDYDLAFKDYFKTLNYDIEIDFRKGIGTSYLVLADTYSSLGDSQNSVEFYKKAITELRASNDSIELATALLNAGDEYLNVLKPDSALLFFMESTFIFNKFKYQTGQAYGLGNMGLAYARQGYYELAEISLLEAISILSEIGDGYAICDYQLYMADVYLELNEFRLAREYSKRAFRIAVEEGYKEQIRDAAEKLSQAYGRLGRSALALEYLRTSNIFRDSLNNQGVIQRMAELRREFEVSQVRLEVQSKSASIKSRPEKLGSDEATYYALIIGVNDYLFSSSDLVDLDQPAVDAQALKKILTSKYEFEDDNILLLKDASRSDVIEAFETISERITEKDNLLIFYAGHGVWDEALQLGYWLPTDATSKSKVNWISNSTIRDYISGLETKHTLLISDACFSGSIFKSRGLKDPLDAYGFYKVYKLSSRKAMTSGTLSTVPDQSRFMEYLIKTLDKNENKYLRARQLFSIIETTVINNTNNIPQYGTIQNAGDEGGDFVFIIKDD